MDASLLRGLLCREVGDKKVIVFANTKANCELVSQTLYAKGYSCTVLHSGKSQVPAPLFLHFVLPVVHTYPAN